MLFLTADGVAMLLVARVAQGVATGAAITTLAPTLVDLEPTPAGRAGLVNASRRWSGWRSARSAAVRWSSSPRADPRSSTPC